MKQEHQVLWKKIERFELDDPAAVFPFSKKLASENKWSLSFARLAMIEYKKFLLLCCISPRGASPSQVVDKVWHLHLTYTHNYWDELCSKVLHKQLHHHPSAGGSSENKKHQEWYRETLELYMEIFDEMPLSVFWQAPVESEAFKHKNDIANLNQETLKSYTRLFPGESSPDAWPASLKCEVIALASDYKKSIRFTPLVWLATCGVVLLFIRVTQLQFGVINPYLLPGPQFLEFLCTICFFNLGTAVLLLLRMQPKLEKLIRQSIPETYTYYDLIDFVHGKTRALQTALLELVNNQLLELTASKKFINHVTDDSLLPTGNPLLPVLAKLAKERLQQIIPSPDDELSYEDLKQLLDHSSPAVLKFPKVKWLSSQSYSLAWVPYRIVLLIAIIRLIQGWSNNRPVGYLLFGMFLFTIAFILINYLYSPRQIARQVLNKEIEKGLLSQYRRAPNDRVIFDFSYRGAPALAGLENYTLLATTIAILPEKTNANSDGGGGGCGSGGDGGGSCGGGGCGGCGGGGCGG